MILEMYGVNQLLVDMASPHKHLSKANTEVILNECFYYSVGTNFDSDDKKIADL
jgi:hypothetical protein